MKNQDSNKPFIGVVPRTLRKSNNLGSVSLNQLNSNQSNVDASKVIDDLGEDDHIIVTLSSKVWFQNTAKIKCHVSLVITEPTVVQWHYYKFINLYRKRFFRVFTRYPALAKASNNLEVLTLCDTWIPESAIQQDIPKTKQVSLIASAKNKYEGHKLRHQAVNTIQQLNMSDIDILGSGYAPFKNKEDGLQPYMFSIVIENCREAEYFSEKILDCFFCKTIPIYWGTADIGQYFDLQGIIVFEDVEELVNILSNITKERYDDMLEAVLNNYQTAKKFRCSQENLIHKMEEILHQNESS